MIAVKEEPNDSFWMLPSSGFSMLSCWQHTFRFWVSAVHVTGRCFLALFRRHGMY